MAHRRVILENETRRVLKYAPRLFSACATPVRQTVPLRTRLCRSVQCGCFLFFRYVLQMLRLFSSLKVAYVLLF